MKQPMARFVLLFSMLSGCATGRIDERMDFWRVAAKKELKSGTSLADARLFFGSQGIELRCDHPLIVGTQDVCTGLESNVGHGLIMEYSVLVTVHLSSDHNVVTSVGVERMGLGF